MRLLSYENEITFTCKLTHFHMNGGYTWPRFDREAFVNSQISYSDLRSQHSSLYNLLSLLFKNFGNQIEYSPTVQPVYNGPLSGGQFTKSRFFPHTNAVSVPCIKLSPLFSGCGHSGAVLCLSFFISFSHIKRALRTT